MQVFPSSTAWVTLSLESRNLYFADVATPLLDKSGEPLNSVFLDDGLHLNDFGYEKWTRVIGPILEEILGK